MPLARQQTAAFCQYLQILTLSLLRFNNGSSLVSKDRVVNHSVINLVKGFQHVKLAKVMEQ